MPNTSILDGENETPAESWEELLDNEYEDSLNDYGDGNQEADWPNKKSKKENNGFDLELDDEDEI